MLKKHRPLLGMIAMLLLTAGATALLINFHPGERNVRSGFHSRSLPEHEQILQHIRNSEFIPAEQLLHSLNRQDPGNTRTLRYLGVVCFYLGKYKKAESCFRTALLSNSTDPVLRNNLGVILLVQHRNESGLRELIHAERLSRQAPYTICNLLFAYTESGNSVMAKYYQVLQENPALNIPIPEDALLLISPGAQKQESKL